MSPLQSAKILVMEATNLSKDALHVYMGLGVMLVAAILLKRSLRDWLPISAVAFLCFAGEVWDVTDTALNNANQVWGGNLKDLWNTMFWPTILFMLARFTGVLRR